MNDKNSDILFNNSIQLLKINNQIDTLKVIESDLNNEKYDQEGFYYCFIVLGCLYTLFAYPLRFLYLFFKRTLKIGNKKTKSRLALLNTILFFVIPLLTGILSKRPSPKILSEMYEFNAQWKAERFLQSIDDGFTDVSFDHSNYEDFWFNYTLSFFSLLTYLVLFYSVNHFYFMKYQNKPNIT